MAGLRDPIGRELAGLVARLGYERWLTFEIIGILEGTWKRVIREILTNYENLSPRDRAQLASLGTQVRRMLLDGFGEVARLSDAELTAFARIEQEATAATVAAYQGAIDAGTVGPLLSRAQVLSIARLDIQGLGLGEWWSAQASTMSQATRWTIQLGLARGAPAREIAAEILPPGDRRRGGVSGRSYRDATTLVRTTITAVSNQAAMTIYEAAGDVVPMVQFRATLDERTTPICRAADGKVFRKDDSSAPIPPLHVNCRSTLVPFLNWKAIGREPPEETSGLGFKTYANWLRAQSNETQERILGKARAEAWRDGQETLGEVVLNDKRTFTHTQMRHRLELDTVAPARRSA